MKRLMMTLSAVLCYAMATTVFTGCAGDALVPPPMIDPTPAVSASMDCLLEISEESSQSFDYFVKYYDQEGTVQSEQVVWQAPEEDPVKLINKPFLQWKKQVTTSLPSKLGFFLEVKPKPDIDLSNPSRKHKCYVGYTVNFKTVRESGNGYANRSQPYGHDIDIKSSDVETYFSQGFGRIADFIYTIDENGEISDVKFWE